MVANDVGGGTYPGLEAGDPQCAANVATHRRAVVNDPIIQGLADTDNSWFQSRSLINYVERINVPVHISGANQDEQTGPRGPYHLWEALQGVPKRLVMSNGDHGTQTNPEFQADRLDWMDHWMRGEDNGFGSWKPGRKYTPTSVVSLFETQGGQSGGRVVSKRFPLENSWWRNVYLHEGGALDFKAPTGPEAFFSSATATDTEFFVQLIDEGPDGSRQYLQRGMLRASHRAVDRALSDKLAGGTIYRPYRPHTNPTDITPLEINEYLHRGLSADLAVSTRAPARGEDPHPALGGQLLRLRAEAAAGDQHDLSRRRAPLASDASFRAGRGERPRTRAGTVLPGRGSLRAVETPATVGEPGAYARLLRVPFVEMFIEMTGSRQPGRRPVL